MKGIIDFVKEIFKEFSEDKVPRLSAALAYFTIFSIGPLLVIAIAVASIVFEEGAARAQIVSTLGALMGEQGAEAIDQAIENANKGGAGFVATAIGVVTLLLGASGVFGQLKDALNTMWEVRPKAKLGILFTIKERFFSFTMVLGTGFLLLVSLVISAGLSALGTFLRGLVPGFDLVWQVVNFIISLLVVALMFALLFKYLPDVKIGWSDVWVGALVTAIIFTVGQIGIGLWLGSGNVGSAWGGAGALVIVLMWIYFSSLIFFIGAEFTQVYAKRYGSRVVPQEHAEFVTEEARAREGLDAGERRKDKDTDGSDERRRRHLRASPWFE